MLNTFPTFTEMIFMKKLLSALFLAAATSVALTSCDQLNLNLGNSDAADLIEEIATASNKTLVEPENIPAKASAYISTNYFDSYIDVAYKVVNSGYEIALGSGDELYFDLDGTSLDSLATMDSCSNGGGRHGHGHHGQGGDSTGVHPHFHHGANCGGVDSVLDVNSLPASIVSYVSTTYGDSVEIRHAKLDDAGQYIVAIDGHILLVFDASGNFVEVAQFVRDCGGQHGDGIPVDSLSADITDYISTHYAGAEIKRALLKENGNIIVGILYNGERKILIFDANGNFIAERD
jgi:Putative beta-lactamase-inhibitor-like, PepSY-like